MPSVRLPHLDYFGRWPFGPWMSYGPPLGHLPFASLHWLLPLFVSIGELLFWEVAFWAVNVVWASVRTPSIHLLALTVVPFRLHRWVISSIPTPSLSLLLFFFQTILCLGGHPFSAGRWVISLIPPPSLIQPFLCFQTIVTWWNSFQQRTYIKLAGHWISCNPKWYWFSKKTNLVKKIYEK